VTLRIYNCTKPIIAAFNGPAVGIGVTMSLPMDIRLASEEAKFGFVFARRGIAPEAASSWFLPRVVGISKAMEWVATGRIFGAEEAREGGLVSEVLAPEALLPRAQELAAEIAANTSAVSVALSRQMMWKMLGAQHPMEAHRIDSAVGDFMGARADAREGVESFLQKRPAEFSMRVSSDLPNFYPWWEEPKYED
jgi:enoyl-CoA hydratase/carnithine racemase